MVRRGSTVRVRQRALRESPGNRAFLSLAGPGIDRSLAARVPGGYTALGGTWGLGAEGTYSATGVRVVAGVVVLLLVAAVLVVLARVGLWQQALVSDRMIRFFAWALAAIFLVETLAAFTWGRGESEWWLYGPVALVLGLLALVVAGSGGAWHIHRPHWTLPSH